MQESLFKSLLKEAGLHQKELGEMLGIDPGTVNRWDGKNKQSRAAPLYAIQFLRAYLMLTPEQRAQLDIT